MAQPPSCTLAPACEVVGCREPDHTAAHHEHVTLDGLRKGRAPVLFIYFCTAKMLPFTGFTI
jgi:hypothetical protein